MNRPMTTKEIEKEIKQGIFFLVWTLIVLFLGYILGRYVESRVRKQSHPTPTEYVVEYQF